MSEHSEIQRMICEFEALRGVSEMTRVDMGLAILRAALSRVQSDEKYAAADGFTPAEIAELNRDLVTDIMALSNYSDDPMWANHAEVPKAWLKRWLAKLNEMPRLLAMLERSQTDCENWRIAYADCDLMRQQYSTELAALRRQLAENVELMQKTADTYAFELASRNTTIDTLRRQLAEREAEVERLKVSAKSSAEENEYLHNKLCEAHLDPSK